MDLNFVVQKRTATFSKSSGSFGIKKLRVEPGGAQNCLLFCGKCILDNNLLNERDCCRISPSCQTPRGALSALTFLCGTNDMHVCNSNSE